MSEVEKKAVEVTTAPPAKVSGVQAKGTYKWLVGKGVKHSIWEGEGVNRKLKNIGEGDTVFLEAKENKDLPFWLKDRATLILG